MECQLPASTLPASALEYPCFLLTWVGLVGSIIIMFATEYFSDYFLPSIHSLRMNPLKDEGAHIVAVALKTMKKLQHLK